MTPSILAKLARQSGSMAPVIEAIMGLRKMTGRATYLGDELHVEFSARGWAALAATGAMVMERMRLSFTALATGDAAMAEHVIEGRPAFEEHVAKMRVAHLARLEERLPESRASSSHHLEVLTLFRQLDASVTRVAGWILQIYAS